MDWDNPPEFVAQALGFAEQGFEIAKSWLLSPAAWTQFALLVVAYLAAVYVSRKFRPFLTQFLTPPEEQTHAIARTRRFVLMFVPLLLPLLTYVFTGVGESVTRSIFGSGEVIAFGKRVFLFLAVRILARDIITEPFLKLSQSHS